MLPALLSALAERTGPAIDNLDKAEKLGLIESADSWMKMRRLRNQMVHEYIEDLAVLISALRSGHAFVPVLVAAARRCVAQVHRSPQSQALQSVLFFQSFGKVLFDVRCNIAMPAITITYELG